MTKVYGAAIDKPDLIYVEFPYADFKRAFMGMGASESVAVMLIGCQGKIGHKSLPVPLRYPGYLTHITYQCYPVYSVFHNYKIWLHGLVMKGGDNG